MTITSQDLIVGQKLIEEYLENVNNDKTTKICASDIGQFLGEYYPEMFENIASDNRAFDNLNATLRYSTNYFSFGWLATEWLANYNTMSNYNPQRIIAEFNGYDSFEEFESYAMIICDSAIDGYLVFY